MPNDIGPKIGVQGEGEFKKQIAQINTSMKTLTAETKAVTTAFIGNENSMEALTAKSELLASKSEQLNTKLDAQKARLKQLDDAGIDPTSASYQKLLQDMYNTEAALNQNEAELKKNKDAMDNFGKETKDAGDNVKKLGDNSISVGKLIKANLISEAIVGGIKALGSAIKDSVKALSGAITDSANWADDLDALSKETGLTTTELQKLQYASELIDVSVETITGSMAKLTKNMLAASKGSGDVYDAFKALGVETLNQDGTLRDRNEVFAETIDALGKIEDATNRDAVAMTIFGKSAQELNPLILEGGDALKQLGDEAEAAGLILEQDSIDKLSGVTDAMYKMQTATDNAKRVLAVEFAEPVAEGITKVTETIQRLVGAFSEGGLEGLADEMGRVIQELGAEIAEKAPEIANALSTLIEAVVPLATQVIETIVQVLTQPDTITLLITSAGKIIAALAEGLLKALPDIFMALAQVLASLLTAIGEWMSPVLEKGREIVQKIGEGIKNAAHAVAEWASDLISRFVTAVTTLWAKVKEIGTNIVTGIWEGIKEKFDWLKEKVNGFFDGIVGGVKQFLGINSPSKVFAAIGRNIADGVPNGMGQEQPSVIASAKSFAKGVVDAVADTVDKEAGAVAEAMQDLMKIVTDAFNGIKKTLGLQSDISALEYELWERQYDSGNTQLKEAQAQLALAKEALDTANAAYKEHPYSATKAEVDRQQELYDLAKERVDLLEDEAAAAKYAKKEAMLNDQLGDQKAAVDAAAEALANIVNEYGEGSDESLQYQKTLLQEQLTYQKLVDSMNEVVEKRKELGSMVDAQSYGVIPEQDITMASGVSNLLNGLQSIMLGNNGGSYTFNLTLPDGTVFARYALPALIDVASANGTPILNPV